MKNPNVKQFYWMISGTLTIHPQGKPEAVGGIQLNAVVATEKAFFPTSGLVQAQRALQQQLADRMPQPFEVVDVQYNSISGLGMMTPEEFHDMKEEAQQTMEDVAPATVQ